MTTIQKNTEALLPSLNRVPEELNHIHLMGICGTGMASLAGLLKEKGYVITGSDQNIYPPMSTFLEKLSIPVMKGYSPDNLHPKPDLVIVGNVITRDNPEALELACSGIPYQSFPQMIKEVAISGKRSIVVAGTHGKTTTSSIISWILERAGMDPSFMIGGIPINFQKNFKFGHGNYFVAEGDEYDTAFFDKGPKFLHYDPSIVIITSIEFDHADIYKDLNQIVGNFKKLIALIPEDGILVANGEDTTLISAAKDAKCPVVTYGVSGNPLWKATEITVDEKSTHITITKSNRKYVTLQTPIYGRHNISNLLSTVAVSDFLEIPTPTLCDAVKAFRGVKRRQEVVGEKRDILVLDDFAHHPTSVRETIGAVKEKYKDRRLVAVFEPRSNSSRRNIFQSEYASAFNDADLVMVPKPILLQNIPPEDRFSSAELVTDLRKRGLNAFHYGDADELLEALHKASSPKDVILIMSNGPFNNIHQKLLNRLNRE